MPFTMSEMAKEVIPKTLKSEARLKFIDKGGKRLTTKADIFDIMDEVVAYLEEAAVVERERRERDRSNNRNQVRDRNRSNKPNPCKKHPDKHDWADCPDNPANKETSVTDIRDDDLSSDEESTSEESLESGATEYDDDEINAIEHNRESKPHPVTVMTLTKKTERKRVPTKVLLNQCCTGNGIISYELAMKLGRPFKQTDETLQFKTAAGTFETNTSITIPRCMFPCLSTSDKLDITLMEFQRSVR